MYNNVKNHIFNLENELIKSKVRKSSEKVSDLLDDNFFEFCSSGKEYRFNKNDTLLGFEEEELCFEIIDFRIEWISDNCLLALYKAIKHNETDVKKKYTNRSSIWKCKQGKWKLYFHQGTYTTKSVIEKQRVNSELIKTNEI